MTIEDNESYISFAKTIYTNSLCISENEFKQDLKRISTLRRILTEYESGRIYNLKYIVNLFITIYNTFDKYNVEHLFNYKLDIKTIATANTFILFLNMPPVSKRYNPDLFESLVKEYKSNANT